MISKHTNTSYSDTANITPSERAYILQFIVEDLTQQKEILDRQAQMKNKK